MLSVLTLVVVLQHDDVINRTLGCAEGSPGVYSRVSDAFAWIRFQVCQNSVAPPTYLNCATSSSNPNTGPAPTPSTPQSPIGFRYEVGADGYFYENGTTKNRDFACFQLPALPCLTVHLRYHTREDIWFQYDNCTICCARCHAL